ncbi:MAG: phospholipase D-like domain-containing protein [Verrucomicrobiales bacterium]|nr:phospholipase D-like domain-containing protein [Verrucomicrobiales bacterium]
MRQINELLRDSLNDASVSRSERRELKGILPLIQGDRTALAKTRQLAFTLATEKIQETGNHKAMEWLEDVIKLLYSNEMSVKASSYFSPGKNCLNRICRFINETKKKIDICVFTITDDRITSKIEEALTKGIHIRIISDNTKSEDRGSDLDRLRGTGIECRFDKTSAHMHHKFAISDNDLLLNGSYNWTRSACTENNENILVSNNAKLVQSFQNEFNRLWDSLS